MATTALAASGCVQDGGGSVATVLWKGDYLCAVALSTGCVALYHGGYLMELLHVGDVTALAWVAGGEVLLALQAGTLERWTRGEEPKQADALPVRHHPAFEKRPPTRLKGAGRSVDWSVHGVAVAIDSYVRVIASASLQGRMQSLELSNAICSGDAPIEKLGWSAVGCQLCVVRDGCVEMWTVSRKERLALKKAGAHDDDDDEEEGFDGPRFKAAGSVLPHPKTQRVVGFDFLPNPRNSVGVLLTLTSEGTARVWTRTGRGAYFLCHSIASLCTNAVTAPCAVWIRNSAETVAKGAIEAASYASLPYGLLPIGDDDDAGEQRDQIAVMHGNSLQIYSVQHLGALPRRGITSCREGADVMRWPLDLAARSVACASAGSGRTKLLVVSAQSELISLQSSAPAAPFLRMFSLTGHSKPVACMSVHPWRPLVASADADEIILWHLDPLPGVLASVEYGNRRQLLRLCSVRCPGVRRLAWSPDEATLFAATPVGVTPFWVRVDASPLLLAVQHDDTTPPTTPLTVPADSNPPPVLSLDALPHAPCCYALFPSAVLEPPAPQPIADEALRHELAVKKKKAERAKLKKQAAAGGAAAPEAGKGAMMNKYAHLIAAKKAAEAPKEEATAAPPADDPKAALRAKYAHLLAAKAGGGIQLPPSEDEAAKEVPEAEEGGGGVDAAVEEYEATVPEQPEDGTPVDLKSWVGGSGLGYVALATADGRVRVWSWEAAAVRGSAGSGGSSLASSMNNASASWNGGAPAGLSFNREASASGSLHFRHPEPLQSPGIPCANVTSPKSISASPVATFLLLRDGCTTAAASVVPWRHGCFAVAGVSGSCAVSAAVLNLLKTPTGEVVTCADLPSPVLALTGVSDTFAAVTADAKVIKLNVQTDLERRRAVLFPVTERELTQLDEFRNSPTSKTGAEESFVSSVACAIGGDGALSLPHVVVAHAHKFEHFTGGSLEPIGEDTVAPNHHGFGGRPTTLSSGRVVLTAYPWCISSQPAPREAAFQPMYGPDLISFWLEGAENADIAKKIFLELLESMTAAAALDPRHLLRSRVDSSLNATGVPVARGREISHVTFKWSRPFSAFIPDDSAPAAEYVPLTKEQSEQLAEKLARASLPDLTEGEALRLLALLDVEKKRAADGEALDEAGLHAMHHIRIRRVLQLIDTRSHHKLRVTEQTPLPWMTVAYAVHSECTDSLLSSIVSLYGSVPMWNTMLSLRLPLWLRSNALLRDFCEKLANSRFQEKKDPRDAALLYCCLGKRAVLAALFKAVREKRTADFFLRDFSEPANRAAASKNAMASIAKGNIQYAAAFFVAADRAEDAAGLIVQRTGNWTLAFLILRLVDDAVLLGEKAKKFLQERLAVETDPWCTHIVRWKLGAYKDAARDLLGIRKAERLYEIASIVMNRPQLRLAMDTMLPPIQRCTLLLRSIRQHLEQGRLAVALRYHRLFAKAYDQALADEKSGALKEAKRRRKATDAEHAAIETGTMDFGGIFGVLPPQGSAHAPSDTAGAEDESDSDGEDAGIDQINIGVISLLRRNLAMGLLTQHLETVGREVCCGVLPRIAAGEAPAVAALWLESIEGTDKVIAGICDELHQDPRVLRADLRAHLEVHCKVVALCLLAGLPATVPTSVLQACNAVYARLNVLPLAGPIELTENRPAMAVQLAAVLCLGKVVPKFRPAPVFAAFVSALSARAWMLRNVPLLFAVCETPAKGELDLDECLGWAAKVMITKATIEEQTCESWEQTRQALSCKNEAEPEVILTRAEVANCELLRILVTHRLSFRSRIILPRSATTSSRGLPYYLGCVLSGERILQQLNSILPLNPALVHFTHAPAALALAAITPSMNLSRTIRGICREQLRVDLTGAPLAPPPAPLFSWGSAVKRTVKNSAVLAAVVDHVLAEMMQAPKLHSHGYTVGAACSRNEVAELLKQAPKTKISVREDAPAVEEYKAKKGPIFAFCADDPHLALCEQRGLHDVSHLQDPRPPVKGPKPHAHGDAFLHEARKSSLRSLSNQGRPSRDARGRPEAAEDDLLLTSTGSSSDLFSRTFAPPRSRSPEASNKRAASHSSELMTQLRTAVRDGRRSAPEDLKTRLMQPHPRLPVYIAGGSDTVQLYGYGSPEVLRTYKTQHRDAVLTDLAFSVDGSLLAGVDGKGWLTTWRLQPDASSAVVVSSQVQKESCCSVFFFDEASLVGTVGGGRGPNQFQLYDLMHLRKPLAAPLCVGNLPNEMEATCATVLTPSRDVLVCGRAGAVCLFDLRNVRFPVYHSKVHDHSIRAVTAMPGHDLAALGTSDGDILILNPSTGLEPVQTLEDAHPKSKMFSFDVVSGVTGLFFTSTALYSSGSDGRLCRRSLQFD
ncbi:Regulator of V-ATPase in vacuolar membrane protein 1 [Diplonema papillatum]|nr:Regulator of V-ATPase in vacuolar membrane protein 1 [Diplonema papillatum]